MSTLLKDRLGRGVGLAFGAPYLLALALLARMVGRERAVHIVSQSLSVIPDGIGTLVRNACYQRLLAGYGTNNSISIGTVFSKPTATLGSEVYLGKYCCVGLVAIGSDVLIGDHVHLLSGGRQHGIDSVDVPIRKQHGHFSRITIGDGVWVGSAAVVMADVGEHAVVAAGAIVTAPVPAYAVVAGNPAQVVRSRR